MVLPFGQGPLHRLLIHQVAYVEKRKPRPGSYFSTALMRTMLPSWMRSRRQPHPAYFLATETTSRRCAHQLFAGPPVSGACSPGEGHSSWAVSAARAILPGSPEEPRSLRPCRPASRTSSGFFRSGRWWP